MRQVPTDTRRLRQRVLYNFVFLPNEKHVSLLSLGCVHGFVFVRFILLVSWVPFRTPFEKFRQTNGNSERVFCTIAFYLFFVLDENALIRADAELGSFGDIERHLKQVQEELRVQTSPDSGEV